MGKLITSDGIEYTVTPKEGSHFTLNEMQAFVGGLIQTIYLAEEADYDIMLINEEGKVHGLDYNAKATKLLQAAGGIPGDFIVGNALLISSNEWE